MFSFMIDCACTLVRVGRHSLQDLVTPGSSSPKPVRSLALEDVPGMFQADWVGVRTIVAMCNLASLSPLPLWSWPRELGFKRKMPWNSWGRAVPGRGDSVELYSEKDKESVWKGQVQEVTGRGGESHETARHGVSRTRSQLPSGGRLLVRAGPSRGTWWEGCRVRGSVGIRNSVLSVHRASVRGGQFTESAYETIMGFFPFLGEDKINSYLNYFPHTCLGVRVPTGEIETERGAPPTFPSIPLSGFWARMHTHLT